MKKKLFLIIATLSLAFVTSCSSLGNSDVPSVQTEAPVTTSAEESSSKANYLSEYSGIWYGFGTDGTEAQTPAQTLTFLDDGTLQLGDDTFKLIDKYTAESNRDIQDGSGNNGKILLVFGKDSNGELALASYGIRKSDRQQYTQAMCYYRESSRTNIQDFIQNETENNTTSSSLHLDPGAPEQYGCSYHISEETAIALIMQKYGVTTQLTGTGTTSFDFSGEGRSFRVDRWYERDDINDVKIIELNS